MMHEDIDRAGANDGPSAQTRVFLQPVAAPSILGLFGFAGATFMVAASMAHWFGNAHTMILLAPFAGLFGGLAQFLAGMWSFRARDGLASVMHGMWGAFWMAYALLSVIFATGAAPLPAGPLFPELGYCFIVLAAITWVGVRGAAGNKGLVGTLAFLAAGSTLAAIGYLAGVEELLIVAGYVFLVSAFVAFGTASSLLLKDTHMRETSGVTVAAGEPGVLHGQA